VVEGDDGKRTGVTTADCTADAAATGSVLGRVVAKDGATMAVERLDVELTYGGNGSRRVSADSKP